MFWSLGRIIKHAELGKNLSFHISTSYDRLYRNVEASFCLYFINSILLKGYKANQKFYNYNDIGHHDYLRAGDGTFNYLKDKLIIKRIKNKIKLKNKIYNNNIKSEVVYLRSTFKKHILNFYRFYK